MGPDWFTVIAQIVNFLILVALLKKFLYGPIVEAMNRREAEIASRLDEAARGSLQAAQEKTRYEDLTAELSEHAGELTAKAREEADKLRRELLEKAREEVRTSSDHWQESLRREKEAVLQSLQRQVCEQACTIAGKVMTELADASVEEAILLRLDRRIREMETDERELLFVQLEDAGEVTVRSAFPLSDKARETLVRALGGKVKQSDIRYEVEPSLVCGIEIRTADRALSWNVEDVLGDLRETLTEALETAG